MATPSLNGAVPSGVDPSEKETVPVGVPNPAVTVAVSDTVSPKTDGLGVDPSVVVVGAGIHDLRQRRVGARQEGRRPAVRGRERVGAGAQAREGDGGLSEGQGGAPQRRLAFGDHHRSRRGTCGRRDARGDHDRGTEERRVRITTHGRGGHARVDGLHQCRARARGVARAPEERGRDVVVPHRERRRRERRHAERGGPRSEQRGAVVELDRPGRRRAGAGSYGSGGRGEGQGVSEIGGVRTGGDSGRGRRDVDHLGQHGTATHGVAGVAVVRGRDVLGADGVGGGVRRGAVHETAGAECGRAVHEGHIARRGRRRGCDRCDGCGETDGLAVHRGIHVRGERGRGRIGADCLGRVRHERPKGRDKCQHAECPECGRACTRRRDSVIVLDSPRSDPPSDTDRFLPEPYRSGKRRNQRLAGRWVR